MAGDFSSLSVGRATNFNDALKNAFDQFPGNRSGSWFYNVLDQLKKFNKDESDPDLPDPPDKQGQNQTNDYLKGIKEGQENDDITDFKHIFDYDEATLQKIGLDDTFISKLKSVPEALAKGYNAISDFYGATNEALGELTKNHMGYFHAIQDNFGDTANLFKESSIGMSQDMVDAYRNIGESILLTNEELADSPILVGYTDDMLLPPGLSDDAIAAIKNQSNEYLRVVENVGDAADRFADLSLKFARTYQRQFTEAFKSDKAMLELEVIAQSMKMSSDEVQTIITRSIDQTGEASIQNFKDIVKFSFAAQKETGISAKVIFENFADIKADVQNFGNVLDDEASRIAASLAEVGIAADTLGKMVSKFADFDTAAAAVGDLTAAFGLNIDAMEMMMLANEDQEQFLFKMRDAFEAQGLEFENMNLSQQKILAGRLGIGIEEAARLFDFDKDITSLEDLKAAQEDMEEKDAFKMLQESAASFAQTGGDIEARIKESGSFGIGAKMAPDLVQVQRGLNATATALGEFKNRFQADVNEGVVNALDTVLSKAEAIYEQLQSKTRGITSLQAEADRMRSEEIGTVVGLTFGDEANKKLNAGATNAGTLYGKAAFAQMSGKGPTAVTYAADENGVPYEVNLGASVPAGPQ